MAGVGTKSTLCLLTGVLVSLWCPGAGTINPKWCSRKCTCVNRYETVDCTHRGLTQVPELSNLTKNLYLDNNDIAAVDVDAFDTLDNLVQLNMENNSIVSLSSDHFCGLERLQILNLSRNKLIAFSISSNISEECCLPELRQVLLSSNRLVEISPYLPLWAPGLETLNMSFNQLGFPLFNSSFSTLQSLRVLDLQGNHIYEIGEADFSPLKAIPLNTLSLSECKLVHVEVDAFRGMTELLSLSLSGNNLSPRTLEEIFNAIGNTSQLVKLDLREMVIPNVTVAMLGMLSHLNHLDLFESAVRHIDPELFMHLTNLETLNVGHNELHNLTNLSALKKLRWLHARWNHLTGLNVVELDNLETIDISGNKMESLPEQWLGHKTNLQLLNVSHNEITSVHPECFLGLSLQVLDLSYNKIAELDGTGLKCLRKMYFSHNRLSSVTSKTYANLEHTLEDIDLSYNNLTKVPANKLKDFDSLQELNLAYNSLGRALKAGDFQRYFQSMGHLQKLDLSSNTITEVARYQLQYLHHLNTIDLSHNTIASLGELALREVTTLAKLVITDNLIQAVDTNLLNKMEYLEEVDLGGNPFNCTQCAVLPLLRWINSTMVVVLSQMDHNKYRCYTPAKLAGQYIFDYRPPEDKKCRPHKDLIHTDLDWAMIGVAVVGVVVFLTLAAVLLFYTQICHKLKSLHYRWQIRYREVSGVEFTADPKA